MNKRVQLLKTYTVQLPEGRLGPIRDLYVDDRSLKVEALIVRSRPILAREVVVHPRHIRSLSHSERSIELDMDKKGVAGLPDVEDVPSVADLRAAEMQRYSDVPMYWGGAGLWNATIPADRVPTEPNAQAPTERAEDYHIQSLEAMTGYEVRTADAWLRAYVIDFVVRVEDWTLIYFVVETSDVHDLKALPADRLTRIDWYASAIECDEDAIKAAPDLESVLDRS